MIRKKVILCLMLGIGFSLSSIVFANHAQHGKTDSGMHIDKMAKELNLSESQKEQIKNIMEEKKQKLEEQWKQIEEIKKSAQEKIKSVLTDEQKKNFESFHGKHSHKKHKHGRHENCTMDCCTDKK